jgi:hypothetical protein
MRPAVPDAPRQTIAAPAAKTAAIPIPRVRHTEPCCWVTVPSTSGRLPLYCDTNSMPGLPFCPEHAKQAYPAVKRRLRENALIGGRLMAKNRSERLLDKRRRTSAADAGDS